MDENTKNKLKKEGLEYAEKITKERKNHKRKC